MLKKRVLICGDSFSVDYQPFLAQSWGWVTRLGLDHDITNRSQAGAGEYRITQQVQHADLACFDCVIVSHTSPNRVYCAQHPVHHDSALHSHADLIWNDVGYHLRQDPKNPALRAADQYFRHIYDQDYQEYIYRLMQKNIVETLQSLPVLHLVTLHDKNLDLMSDYINLYQLFSPQQGLPNHYSEKPNQQIYQMINQWISDHA